MAGAGVTQRAPRRGFAAAPAIASAARARVDVRRAMYLAVAAVLGVCVAGFWNVQAVDGLGVRLFVTPIVGEFEGKREAFSRLGPAFGFVFAAAAGLGATFTASNVVSFTLLPLIACSSRGGVPRTLRALATVMAAVAIVGAVYGVFIGRLGPDGVAAFSAAPIRSAQSLAVFTTVGVALMLAAVLHTGLLETSTNPASAVTRAFFAQPSVTAVLIGLAIGAFSIGRPLAVFRELLAYAAQPASAAYAAAVVSAAALATTGLPSLLVLLVVVIRGRRIEQWVATRRRDSTLACASAMAAGGAFLIFYWGLTRFWPVLGRWGFKLGLYE